MATLLAVLGDCASIDRPWWWHIAKLRVSRLMVQLENPKLPIGNLFNCILKLIVVVVVVVLFVVDWIFLVRLRLGNGEATYISHGIVVLVKP